MTGESFNHRRSARQRDRISIIRLDHAVGIIAAYAFGVDIKSIKANIRAVAIGIASIGISIRLTFKVHLAAEVIGEIAQRVQSGRHRVRG